MCKVSTINVYIPLVYAAVPDDSQTTTPPASSPIPKSEDPVADSDVSFQIVVVLVAIAVVIFLLLVIVAMVIFIMAVRKARLGKRVVMLGNSSPIDNPSYVIGT